MITSIVWLITLAVFSGLSMNLILQFGFGLKEMALVDNTPLSEDAGLDEYNSITALLAGLGIFFVALMFLWIFFSLLGSFLFLGLFEYILIFPVSALVYALLKYITSNFVLIKIDSQNQTVLYDNVLTGSMPIAAALFITLNVASGFSEAAILSLGFSCGLALAIAIAGEIRRRSRMELVPQWLRGGPLVIIALGLLSLIFSSGALMLFQILGA